MEVSHELVDNSNKEATWHGNQSFTEDGNNLKASMRDKEDICPIFSSKSYRIKSSYHLRRLQRSVSTRARRQREHSSGQGYQDFAEDEWPENLGLSVVIGVNRDKWYIEMSLRQVNKWRRDFNI